MAQSVKVPEDQFIAAMRALLNTPPTTAKTILKPATRKSGKTKKRG